MSLVWEVPAKNIHREVYHWRPQRHTRFAGGRPAPRFPFQLFWGFAVTALLKSLFSAQKFPPEEAD
jgi:hypothetical protein